MMGWAVGGFVAGVGWGLVCGLSRWRRFHYRERVKSDLRATAMHHQFVRALTPTRVNVTITLPKD